MQTDAGHNIEKLFYLLLWAEHNYATDLVLYQFVERSLDIVVAKCISRKVAVEQVRTVGLLDREVGVWQRLNQLAENRRRVKRDDLNRVETSIVVFAQLDRHGTV